MGFKDYTIEECCEILNNLRFPLNSEQRFEMKGEYPYYGANGVQGYINKWRFDNDLILIAEDGGNFEQYATRPIAYRVNGKCWVNNHAHVIKAKNEFSQSFIFYSLEHKNILFFIAGGTRSKLTQSELKRIILKHPQKEEADKIGNIIQIADEAIAHTEALIAKYQRIKTGLMQDLLTKGIDENGNIRSKETHKFVVKNGIEVPEEWEVKQIEEVAILKSGGTPSRQNLSFWNGNTPWVKTGEINYQIINETEEYVTEKGLANSSAVLFPKDTILMALYGQGKTRGRVAILGIDASTNQACIGFLNLIGITRDFLYITLTNEYDNLRELSNDGAQKNLSGTLLNKYKIKVPINIDEQKRIDLVFLGIDNLINEQKNNLSKLQSLKTGLMQDLLSGKVRVTI